MSADCVCGCAPDHGEHCCHGCTISFPDDGFDHGGSAYASGTDWVLINMSHRSGDWWVRGSRWAVADRLTKKPQLAIATVVAVRCRR